MTTTTTAPQVAVLPRQAFADAIALVERAVAQRSPLPITSCVRLVTDGTLLTLSATNLDMGLTTSIRTAEALPDICVPARLLQDVVSALPGHTVELSLTETGRSLRIGAGTFQTTIKTWDVGDFPPIPAPKDDAPAVWLPTRTLRGLLGAVIHAAAKDDYRPVLHGILIEIRDGQITLAAADGFRLAVAEADAGTEATVSVILPSPQARELLRLLAKVDDADGVELTVGTAQVTARVGATTLTSRLIEGTYPNHRQLIREAPVAVRVGIADLQRGLRAVGVVASESAHIVRFAATADELRLSGAAAEIGDAACAIPARLEGAEALSFSANGDYIVAALAALDGATEVELRTAAEGESTSPILIVSEGRRQRELVMPMVLAK